MGRLVFWVQFWDIGFTIFRILYNDCSHTLALALNSVFFIYKDGKNNQTFKFF